MIKHSSIAITLCLVTAASLTGCGEHKASSVKASKIDQVAQMVARRDDRVSVEDLADWIIQGRKDFTLIDVRSPSEFDDGHIQGARNLPVPELMSAKQLHSLPKDRRIIVYSQGSETAAQSVVMLRLAGFNADLLSGGYNFWAQHVLNPSINPVLGDNEYPSVPKQQAIACYFIGGKGGAAPPPPPPPKPAFVPPVSQPTAPPSPPATREGC
jgi:rhodanese-related sulfurtransferase